MRQTFLFFVGLASALVFGGVPTAQAAPKKPFSSEDLLRVKRPREARISPDGRQVAYVVEVQRKAVDKQGGSYRELHVASLSGGPSVPYITGKVSVSHIRWSPDGKRIGFVLKRGDKKAKKQVWAIPRTVGEAAQLTFSESDVRSFEWNPRGGSLVYLTVPARNKRQEMLKKKGYEFITYEEAMRHRTLFLQKLGKSKKGNRHKPAQLTRDLSVWDFVFAPDGKRIAAQVTEQPLIDQYYMDSHVHLLTLKNKRIRQLTQNPGKLGHFAFSPDGKRLVYAAARERADHAVSQVRLVRLRGKKDRALTPPKLKGHADWATFINNNKVLYLAKQGVQTNYYTVSRDGKGRTPVLKSRAMGLTFSPFHHRAGLTVLSGSSGTAPWELFVWDGKAAPRKLTRLNPWITKRKLGKQSVVKHTARDGLALGGILVKPLGFKKGKRYPLLVVAHGGPEGNFVDGWVTRYFMPSQILAARGYLTFLPNYRTSTGYGVDVALQGLADPAGKEFDDIADAIDHLVNEGLADRDRVGIAGGSYGGYAAAWFGTYYTKYVRAACMFVGISNLISKRGTTDIAIEMRDVHHGKPLEKQWDLMLKRSPVYHAKKSKTAMFIFGGADDPRVHPTQSMELHRRLKVNGHPAVRLVQYPGEGHGNRKQAGRRDVLFRTLQWLDWYVKDKKPLTGPMPPLDIADEYGLTDLPKADKK